MKHLLLTAVFLAASIHAAQPPSTASKVSLKPALQPAAATSSARTTALNFSLQSTTGQTVKLSDFKGKVVMVNFWASWCPPCRAEMPVLDNFAKTYKDAGLVVLGLNVDVESEGRDEFLAEHPVSFLILDDSRWATAKRYVSPSQPATFFIDREGNLAHLHQGYKTGDDVIYAAKVKELLAQ